MKKFIVFIIIFMMNLTLVNAEELSCTTTLKRGIKGSNVEKLQSVLNKVMNCNLEIDGIYGSKTEVCVLKFQKDNKLTETGTVNKTTCNTINSNFLNNGFSVLKKGSKGEEVKKIQTKLNKVIGCNLKLDGIYGSETATCVSNFQNASNLTKTGTVNKETYDVLNSIDENNGFYLTLKKGSKGELVKSLQKRLNKIVGCNLKVDGIYGSATEKCVSKFQVATGLKKTGTFDTNTYDVLTRVENETSNVKELKKGTKGNEVTQIQTKLNEIMGCNLVVDGSFGNLTKACVMKYQMNSNLEVTGTINKITYYKLMNQNTPIEKEKELEINGKSIIVTKDATEIRESVSTSSKVLKKASLGEIYSYYYVVLKKDGNSWYKVKLDDSCGYIKDSNISKNFIVVDKSLQKLILYKSEQVILNTEVVTGMYTNHDTPTGFYQLKVENLKKARTLRGYNDDGTKYASYVDYWMPFITNRGIGFHDATWRSNSEFTDTRYLYDGSHGCVNMKKEAAKTLFNNIDKDIDVIIRD